MIKYFLNIPSITNLEKKYVNDVLKKGWLSSNGVHTNIFEKKFRQFLKRKFSLAVQSGTASIHVALKALGVNSGDKVIIPNYTCVSNISAVSQCGAIPVIVEIEKDTLGLDFQEVKRAIKIHRPKVLQLVHVYGFPARDTKKIVSFCKKNKIKVIEDSSESLGAKIGDKLIGTFGDIGVFSIRSEKMIGVGEGGILVTNDKRIFSRIKLLSSRNSPFRSSKDPYWKKYYTEGEGYNYLLPHLLGALGRAQIERFKKDILRKKVSLGQNYRSILKNDSFLFTQKRIKNHKPVYWLNSIYFKNFGSKKVFKIGEELIKNGIEIRSGFWPLSKMKNFRSIYLRNKFNNSDDIFNKTIVLPSAYALKKEDLIKIKNILNRILKKNKS
jgi:perosamine synthetase